MRHNNKKKKNNNNNNATVSGFLQFTITADMASSGVFFAFGLTTALVCGLMLNTMMICTLIQASILKTGRKFVSEWEEARFVTDCLVRTLGDYFHTFCHHGYMPVYYMRCLDILWVVCTNVLHLLYT